jgi:hypothetical protein
MAAAPASKTGMLLPELKQLMNKASVENPIGCAFGMGDEPAFALLMLHKSKPGPAVKKELEETFPAAKNVRWGSVVVPPETGNLAKFIINKAVSGMAKRLVKTLKGTGYNKVEIVLEDGTVVEGAADDEDAAAAGPAAEAGVAAAPVAGVVPPPPPPMPQAAKPQFDAAQLKQMLGALTPRIGPLGASDSDLLVHLKKLAADAITNLQTNNLTYAAAAIGQLKTALDKAAAAAAAAADSGTSGKAPGGYAQSRDNWLTAHRSITTDIEKLRAELVATYQAEGIAADVEKRFQEKVAPLLTTFDEDLAEKLDQADTATDPAVRSKLVGEARGIMTRFAGALANPIVADLDNNPFVKLSIQATLATTLKGLSATIR